MAKQSQSVRLPEDHIQALESYAEDRGMGAGSALERTSYNGLQSAGYLDRSVVTRTALGTLAFRVGMGLWLIAAAWFYTSWRFGVQTEMQAIAVALAGAVFITVEHVEPGLTKRVLVPLVSRLWREVRSP